MELSDNKSKHGNDFKDELLSLLIQLKKSGQLLNIQIDKKFSYDNNFSSQFLAPYYLETKSNRIAIFTTTSVRSDRLKITQWDSWGIKKCLDKKIVCLLVIPSDLSDKENKNYIQENKKIASGKYYSAIDTILKLQDLNNYLNKI